MNHTYSTDAMIHLCTEITKTAERTPLRGQGPSSRHAFSYINQHVHDSRPHLSHMCVYILWSLKALEGHPVRPTGGLCDVAGWWWDICSFPQGSQTKREPACAEHRAVLFSLFFSSPKSWGSLCTAADGAVWVRGPVARQTGESKGFVLLYKFAADLEESQRSQGRA